MISVNLISWLVADEDDEDALAEEIIDWEKKQDDRIWTPDPWDDIDVPSRKFVTRFLTPLV